MIPKIIHYCWLSGEEYPETIAKCIDSWKETLTDYEFILWDTKRFDITSNEYVMQAYQAKKYAFASDYIRLYALYHYGGIYLDSDIIVFKKFDELLNNKAFCGFENEEGVTAWLLASEKGNPLFGELLSYYDNRDFLFPNGTFDTTPNVFPITNTLVEHGLVLNGQKQELENITIYPRTYFCPVIPYGDYKDCYSENTFAQHLFNGGWIDIEQKQLLDKKHDFEKKYGKLFGMMYYGVEVLKREGIYSFLQQWKIRLEKKKQKEMKK